MLDPVGGFERIRNQYITYLETAFRIRDSGVSAERRWMLEQPGTLATEPFVEPIPRYESVPWTVAELMTHEDSPVRSLGPVGGAAAAALISAGLFDKPEIKPYLHQIEMLGRGLRTGTPGIVTSGTGSGKTESFLLPVIASIAAEGAMHWDAPDAGYLDGKWWVDPTTGQTYKKFSAIPPALRPLEKNPDATPFTPQRRGERRSAAVRCMVLYPMNALVEDQLTRLRAALDSDAARVACATHLKGNRIFFGRYNGPTPVPGPQRHPRVAPKADAKRRHRLLQRLFEHLSEADTTQKHVEELIAKGELLPENRFQFPHSDGAELIDRWNMQETPPDILITNVQMLGAMLNRDVDAPIFDKTAQWLATDPDAYFYLVVDELHLHRGSAGTEVAYLLRSLLYRLGLHRPELRHKLRVLASSASLPVGGEGERESLDYLWDMFGTNGTWGVDGSHAADATDWAQSIIAGEPVAVRSAHSDFLSAELFERVLELACSAGRSELEDLVAGLQLSSIEDDPIWLDVASDLRVSGALAGRVLLKHLVEECSARLEAGCWDSDERRPRATSITELARSLFGDSTRLRAVRGMLVLRGLGDLLRREVNPEVHPVAQSFRIHTFFRAIEGMYAPLDKGASVSPDFESARTAGILSIERPSVVTAGDETYRVFDVLYCECCGELFVGGTRSRDDSAKFELLPSEADLEGLPETSRARFFEDMVADEYAVFWPSDLGAAGPGDTDVAAEWKKAALNSVSGQVRLGSPRAPLTFGAADRPGFVFQFDPRLDKHDRTASGAGSHVPYECPNCHSSYRLRSKGMRLSPVRHFRPGFAKTTQLLASELFELLRIENGDSSKLVSFSDSRQEAARASLDIESSHHEDLRRLLLLRALQARTSAENLDRLQQRLIELRAASAAAAAEGDFSRQEELAREGRKLTLDEAAARTGVVPMRLVLEDSGAPASYLENLAPLELLYSFVDRGVHPFDPAGVKAVQVSSEAGSSFYDWVEAFTRDDDGQVLWRRTGNTPALVSRKQRIVEEFVSQIADVLFSRSYFALEETGLAYLSLSPDAAAATTTQESSTTLLRVFAEAYRVLESRYGNDVAPWIDGRSISKNNRVKLFAQECWGSAWSNEVEGFMRAMTADGHHDGVISVPKLWVRLTQPTDPAWVCSRCTRVHLVRGPGPCTRCRLSLPQEANSTAADVTQRHFIGHKISRELSEPFRLHCEELTGQTDDGPLRQRNFRGVLVPNRMPVKTGDGDVRRDDDGEIVYQEATKYWKAREEIDLLAVTTTMEVGIDIGPLQGILQANMPPQRFNYQQRVGRAGRRGQAFSIAVTVCRTKSHDMHYFRHPRAITGDVPPPPRLSKQRSQIPRRFVNKWVLNKGFSNLRASSREWPGDGLTPPDIHGEFVPTGSFADEGSPWRDGLLAELEVIAPEQREFVAFLLADSPLLADAGALNPLPAELVACIESEIRKRPGEERLGELLAEHGLLPLYGMPTRVRNLYTGSPRYRGDDWKTTDRDLEIAIHEFSPGSTLIKDKQIHTAIGFTGPLPGLYRVDSTINPLGSPFGDPLWLAECGNCRSWSIEYSEPAGDSECKACAYLIEVEQWRECREPRAFRTDLAPKDEADGPRSAGGFRGLIMPKPEENFVPVEGSNLELSTAGVALVVAVNRGDFDSQNNDWPGFETTEMTTKKGRSRLASQQIDSRFIDSETRFGGEVTAQGLKRFWLAAPKTTEIMQLAPAALNDSIELLISGTQPGRLLGQELLNQLKSTAVRAAAVSASFIIANRATMHLDIDPSELDVIEPRVLVSSEGIQRPVLQFADHLVNGSGICTALGEDTGSGPLLGALLRSAVEDQDQYPLNAFLDHGHAKNCTTACYRCLLRYGNQSYHGILDWRLGLAYLRSLQSSSYSAGADWDFSPPELNDWKSVVDAGLRRLIAIAGSGCVIREVRGLPFIQLKPGSPWLMVVHPLWSEATNRRLRDERADDDTGEALFVDSFSLERRPWKVRQATEGS